MKIIISRRKFESNALYLHRKMVLHPSIIDNIIIAKIVAHIPSRLGFNKISILRIQDQNNIIKFLA